MVLCKALLVGVWLNCGLLRTAKAQGLFVRGFRGYYHKQMFVDVFITS